MPSTKREAETENNPAKLAKTADDPMLSGLKNTTLRDGTELDYLLVKVVQAVEGRDEKWQPEADIESLVPGGLAAWIGDAKDVIIYCHGWLTDWDCLGGGDDPTDQLPAAVQMLADGEAATGHRAEGATPLANMKIVCLYWPSDEYERKDLQSPLETAANMSFTGIPDSIRLPAMAAIKKLEADPTAPASAEDAAAINAAIAATVVHHAKAVNPAVPASTASSEEVDLAIASEAPVVKVGDTAGSRAVDGDSVLKYYQNCTTFWNMKGRAYKVGGTAMPIILSALAAAAPESSGKRIHVLGHSFGTVVAGEAARAYQELRAAVTPPEAAPARLGSLTLSQGAISCFVFAGECTYYPYGKAWLGSKQAVGRFVDVPSSIIGPTVITTAKLDASLPQYDPMIRLGYVSTADITDTKTHKPLGPVSSMAYTAGPGTGPAGATWQTALGLQGLVNPSPTSGGYIFEEAMVEASPKPAYNLGRLAPNGRRPIFTVSCDGMYTAADGTVRAFIAGHKVWENAHTGALLWEAIDASRPTIASA